MSALLLGGGLVVLGVLLGYAITTAARERP